MFIDNANVVVTSGNGGNGLISFRREKYVPAGGPDGGDGGNGGSVVFVADAALTTLMDFSYKRRYKAKNGEDGRAARCSGKKGDDLIIKVPAGTIVKNSLNQNVLADLSEDGEEFVAAKGGRGGWGNAHFATPTRQAPRFAKNGTKGETLELVLELKLLADVGIAGLPNVGKSTLLSSCTAAKPKIANYHFTTLKPNLGIVSLGEGRAFVLADIPGLIEGAHRGAGLGHEFLRHLERTRLIIHVVDSSSQSPLEDYETLNRELELYSPQLAKTPQLIAVNKCDIEDGAAETFAAQSSESNYFLDCQKAGKKLDEFCELMQSKNLEVFKISAATGQGVRKLMERAEAVLAKIPMPEKLLVSPVVEEREEEGFSVTTENGLYVVEGGYIDRLAGGINFDDSDSLQFFQRSLKKSGVIDQLRKAGAKEGDTVQIGDMEFDFIE